MTNVQIRTKLRVQIDTCYACGCALARELGFGREVMGRALFFVRGRFVRDTIIGERHRSVMLRAVSRITAHASTYTHLARA